MISKIFNSTNLNLKLFPWTEHSRKIVRLFMISIIPVIMLIIVFSCLAIISPFHECWIPFSLSCIGLIVLGIYLYFIKDINNRYKKIIDSFTIINQLEVNRKNSEAHNKRNAKILELNKLNEEKIEQELKNQQKYEKESIKFNNEFEQYFQKTKTSTNEIDILKLQILESSFCLIDEKLKATELEQEKK